MAYKRSRERLALEAAYREIRATIRLIENKHVASGVRDYVIAASIFLAHAELENYFSDLVSAFAATVSKCATKGSDLPGALRSHLFVEKSNLRTLVANALAGRPEQDLLGAIGNFLGGPVASLVDDAKPLRVFSGSD